MKTFLISLSLVVVMGFLGVMWGISTSNNERMLRNKILAQEEITQAYYTKLWEVLRTKAGVADEYANKFKEIQTAIMEGRYSTGGQMMKWIQEANPNFDPSLYKDVMNSIEGERNGFFIEQKKLVDMQKQHRDMLVTFPSKLIVGKRPPIDIVVLKNVETKKAYETGTDSSPELFK